MALSIRAHSSLPIQVITDGTALERLPCENKVYDIVTEIDFDDWHDMPTNSISISILKTRVVIMMTLWVSVHT